MGKTPAHDPERALNAELGRRIEARRIALALTRAELADAAGVSRQTIYNVEVGAHGIKPTRLASYAEALHISVDELMMPGAAALDVEPLTEITIRTRHPEDYELVNHGDGTRWYISNGKWKAKR